jgi:hypothetical protein
MTDMLLMAKAMQATERGRSRVLSKAKRAK